MNRDRYSYLKFLYVANSQNNYINYKLPSEHKEVLVKHDSCCAYMYTKNLLDCNCGE